MGITEHNQEFVRNPDDDQAFRAIFEGLQDQVRAYIRANFPAELKRTRQVTEFLDDVFLTYKEKVASESWPWVEFNTRRLVGYLKEIARKKLSEARRYEKAHCRDRSRIEHSSTEEICDTTTPDEQLVMEEVCALLHAELLNEERELNKTINIMYFIMLKSAREIEETFRQANQGERSISDSKILRVISNTKARLARLYGSD